METDASKEANQEVIPQRRFTLIARDKSGTVLDTSAYDPSSLDDAAAQGHLLKSIKKSAVMIRDNTSKPPKEYSIDSHGKPML